jgi:hypothetical protein
MKRLLLFLFLLALPFPALAQSFPANLTAQSTNCAVGGSCDVVSVATNIGAATFTLSGTFSGTVQFEASGDGGTTWVALSVTPTNSTTTVTSATGVGTWQANVAGFTGVRIRCSTYTSGTIVATIQLALTSARSGGGGSGGGVTSIATTSPITGGTITTIGTIACGTCETNGGTPLTSGKFPKSGTSPALADSSISDNGQGITAAVNLDL